MTMLHNMNPGTILLMMVKVLLRYRHMIYERKFCSMSLSMQIKVTIWDCLLF